MAINILSLAKALGGDVAAGQVLCPGPNHSREDRSLAIRPLGQGPEDWLIYSYAGDDYWTCLKYIRRLLGSMADCPAAHHKPTSRSKQDAEQRARSIWDNSEDAAGTLVESYLARRRLTLPECGEYAIRFHPKCPWEHGTAPAMVAAFRDIANSNLICGIHRTALTLFGDKIGRKMLGRARGAAIMLDPDDVVNTGLAIAEGIESGLAGRTFGWRPCWVLGSVGAIARFPVLAGIECLNIMGELDDGGANAGAIEIVGARWVQVGCEVLKILPRHGGDLNDALRRLA